MRIEDVEDYLREHPDNDIGPWEAAGHNLDFVEVVKRAVELHLKVQVIVEYEGFVADVRVSSTLPRFTAAQVMFIMNHLSGDEVTGYGECGSGGASSYIDIWWD